MMFRLERAENLCIGVADRSTVAVREIDAAGGQADVIQNPAQLGGRDFVAYGPFYLIDQTCGLFDASAGLGANMQPKLTGVYRGKEIVAQGRQQQNTRSAKDKKARGKEKTAIKAELQDPGVPVL
jgi:hypothetical protein